jgi:tetratricopeptide (TPR) repeat protein
VVFRWLKGRSTKTQPETEAVVKPPVGMGTIELNPFGVNSIVDSSNDTETVMMPELDLSNETEVWSALDGVEEDAVSVPDGALSDESEPMCSAETPVRSVRVDSSIQAPTTRPCMIPSLRREALRLKYELDQLDPEGHQEQTPELWKSYLRLMPTDKHGWLSLGEFHLVRGELSKAEVVFRTALEFQPQDSLTSGALGHTLMEQGKFNDARSFLDVACQGMPEEMDLQQSLLSCLKSCGDTEAVRLQGVVIEELRRGIR